MDKDTYPVTREAPPEVVVAIYGDRVILAPLRKDRSVGTTLRILPIDDLRTLILDVKKIGQLNGPKQ